MLANRKKCNFLHFSTVKSAIFCTKKNGDGWLRYANHQDFGCGYLLLLYNIDDRPHQLFVEVNRLAFKISYTQIKEDWKFKRRKRGAAADFKIIWKNKDTDQKKSNVLRLWLRLRPLKNNLRHIRLYDPLPFYFGSYHPSIFLSMENGL